VQALTTAAAGVILFLIYDVLAQAVEPVDEALDDRPTRRRGRSTSPVYAAALAGSVAFGLLSVTYLTQRMHGRGQNASALAEAGCPRHGRGAGVAQLLRGAGDRAILGDRRHDRFALILVIGFALHNATEGFAIGAPLGMGERPSWGFLAVAGVVGGGPTFLGGVVGYVLVSPLLSILFLGLAAGALIFVFNEMMAVARRFSDCCRWSPEPRCCSG
jgi:ZIP family zinc transporter